jgi:glutamyl-tRNA synthetase
MTMKAATNHPHAQRIAPQRQRNQHQDRADARPDRRHFGSGQQRVADPRQRARCRGGERQTHAQRQPRPQREQADRQHISRADHRADVKPADRQQMGQPGIAHRIFIGAGNSAAVAARERRRNRPGGAAQPLADMARESALDLAKPTAALHRDQHLRLAQHTARGRQSHEPGSAREIIRAGQHRRSRRHQPRLQPHDRAFGQLWVVVLAHQVDPHPHGFAAGHSARDHGEPHAIFGTAFLARNDPPSQRHDCRAIDRHCSRQRGFGPDRNHPRRDHQRHAEQCGAYVGVSPVAARSGERAKRHRAAPGEQRQPTRRIGQHEPRGDARGERHRQPPAALERSRFEERLDPPRHAGQARAAAPRPRRSLRPWMGRKIISAGGGRGHAGASERKRKVMASSVSAQGAKPGLVVTRFAPSPTGYLHIGGARTALFNWLFARHHGGKYLLRIEDTDRARSTEPAIAAILDGLAWLGLEGDEPPVFQFARSARHAEVAAHLLAAGHAYRCYLTPEELTERRALAQAERRPFRIHSEWRGRDSADAPAGLPFVVRIKAPREGETVIEDRVQGRVTVANAELDDFVLLRSDGTPTYMLAVVVDDHDMGVTHVIRGDDHLNNAFRQLVILDGMKWAHPVYAHVPLIHGADGAKLSKRHGALGVDAYRDGMGLLPETVLNYLLRLGWGHGDREVISREEATALFELDGVGKSPSRFDTKKLLNLNGHYLREADPARLADLVAPRLAAMGSIVDLAKLTEAMPELQPRAQDLDELARGAAFLFVSRPLAMDPKAAALLTGDALTLLGDLNLLLGATNDWTTAALEATLKAEAEQRGLGLGKLAQPLRAALTGQTTSPGIFDVLALLGRDESLARIRDRLAEGVAATT